VCDIIVFQCSVFGSFLFFFRSFLFSQFCFLFTFLIWIIFKFLFVIFGFLFFIFFENWRLIVIFWFRCAIAFSESFGHITCHFGFLVWHFARLYVHLLFNILLFSWQRIHISNFLRAFLFSIWETSFWTRFHHSNWWRLSKHHFPFIVCYNSAYFIILLAISLWWHGVLSLYFRIHALYLMVDFAALIIIIS